MSLPEVFERGDDFVSQYPRTSALWNVVSHATCLLTVGFSKTVLGLAYNTELKGIEKLDHALEQAHEQDRGLLTVMNHMSVVDDPFIWGCLPWRYYRHLDNIRWCLGAHNVCFQNAALSYFFSLGKILSTERFGGGPFQGSIDAAVRILSPDDTLGLLYDGTDSAAERAQKRKQWLDPVDTHLIREVRENYIQPIRRSLPSWVHVFPEGFVLQLQPPFNNSMRYFKWGITRLVLESTRQPIIVPIFTHGFEKIAPESAAGTLIERFLPANYGTTVKVTIGDPIDDNIIQKYREEWLNLVEKHADPNKPGDLSDYLKFGAKAQDLRSRLASELRKAVADVRLQCGFTPEDPRFKQHKFWERYTRSEGASDPDIKFIGRNWAIRRLQKFLPEYNDNDDTKEK